MSTRFPPGFFDGSLLVSLAWTTLAARLRRPFVPLRPPCVAQRFPFRGIPVLARRAVAIRDSWNSPSTIRRADFPRWIACTLVAARCASGLSSPAAAPFFVGDSARVAWVATSLSRSECPATASPARWIVPPGDALRPSDERSPPPTAAGSSAGTDGGAYRSWRSRARARNSCTSNTRLASASYLANASRVCADDDG